MRDKRDTGAMGADGAGGELARLLIDAKLSGRLSARQVCVLSFYAVRAGAVGFAHQLAVRRDAPGTSPDAGIRQ